MSKLKLAILDDYLDCARDLADWSDVERHADITVFTEPFGSEQQAVRALAPFDILCLMRDRTPFPATLLRSLPKLRLVTYTGSINRSFDAEAAAALGISVRNATSSRGLEEHAEFIWALIMATARKIAVNDAGMRAGKWQTDFGIALHGKTMGILGLGNFGTRVARFARVFGMEVLAWSENLTAQTAVERGAKYASFTELLTQSDVITTHLVLSDRTRNLIGKAEFAQMKPGALFINTSRGEIVDENALVAALQNKVIGGAGLDVFSQEPLPIDHPLRRLPNALLSPHMGFSTRELLTDFHRQTAKNVSDWLDEFNEVA